MPVALIDGQWPLRNRPLNVRLAGVQKVDDGLAVAQVLWIVGQRYAVARALQFPYSLGDRVSKMIPMGSQGFPITLDIALDTETELKELLQY